MTKRRSLFSLLLLVCLALSSCAPLVKPAQPAAGAASSPTAPPRILATTPAQAPRSSPSPSSRATPPATTVARPNPASPTPGDFHKALNITYAQLAGVDPNLLSLDVYYNDPVSAKRPVVIYVHGGGWIGGDKAHVGAKAEFFTQAGYVFISANYRLSPQAKFPAHVQDVASAILWTVKTIAEFGGDPNQIYLMGHSAGGQLVTLVATDERYLQAHGVGLAQIKGVIALDTAAYDIAVFASLCKNHVLPEPYSIPFGQDPAEWKYASPVTYVAPGKQIPPIAVIYSGDVGIGSSVPREQLAADFQQKLVKAGIPSQLFGAPDKNHSQINDEFGQPGDTIAPQVLAFLTKIQSSSK